MDDQTLTTDTVAALSTDEVAALTTDEVAALTTDAVVALATTDIAALSTDDIAALEPADAAPVSESFLDRIESTVEAAIDEAVTVAQEVFHVIEQRSFGRPSAEHPMVVNNVIGGQ